MLKSLRQFLSPPHFADDEKNRIAAFLNIITLTIFAIAILVSILDVINGIYVTMIAMAGLALPMAIAFWVNRLGKTTLASYLVLFGGMVAATLTLAVGQGIHDIGIIDYGLILIVASYLLKRRGIVVVTVAIIVSVAVVVFGEMYGLLPVQVTPDRFAPRVADFLIVSITILIGAVGIALLSQTLENSLKKSKEMELRWRALVDSIPDIVALLDKDGKIISVNHVTEGNADNYIGRSVFDILISISSQTARADVNAALAGESLTREVEIRTSQGKSRWYSISLGPLVQPDGKTGGVIAVLRDIQARKDADLELRQSREALSNQTRHLETLQKISRSVTMLNDLQGTLHLVLEQIKAILPMDAFVVVLYDQKTNIVSFPLIYDEGNFYEEAPRPLFPESLVGEAIQTRETVILNRTPEQIKNDVVSTDNRLGSKKASASVLTAPMIIHEQVIGTISVHSYALNTYNLEHVAVLSGAANQIAIAIENARLYETSQTRADQLETLNEIGRSISTLRDLNGVLENAYQMLHHTLELDAFYIALYHADSKTVSYPLIIDEGKSWDEPVSTLNPETHLGRSILNGQAFLINRSNEEVVKRETNLPDQDNFGNKAKVSASLMLAPLQFGGKNLGAISTQSYKEDAYSADDLDFLVGVANQVAIAIENARLYTEQQKELSERKRAEAEVRNLNADLETRVSQRTAELEAANKELASFTYTVSHDLRAPIRGIHGLSHIIIEEFEQQLPAEAIAHIRRIQANARQMGRLIDELLAFTHLGRQPVRKTTLDMKALFETVIRDLSNTECHQVEFSVEPLPPAYGDLLLIQQALTNLIANAIKFTCKKEAPRVEIGSLKKKGEIVYFIRDNGVGFDMNYANKLFGVFERLHREDEFEGTGVGLAIVKRIIDKHDGRIWADAKVNEGAIFYFTLPPQKGKSK